MLSGEGYQRCKWFGFQVCADILPHRGTCENADFLSRLTLSGCRIRQWIHSATGHRGQQTPQIAKGATCSDQVSAFSGQTILDLDTLLFYSEL